MATLEEMVARVAALKQTMAGHIEHVAEEIAAYTHYDDDVSAEDATAAAEDTAALRDEIAEALTELNEIMPALEAAKEAAEQGFSDADDLQSDLIDAHDECTRWIAVAQQHAAAKSGRRYRAKASVGRLAKSAGGREQKGDAGADRIVGVTMKSAKSAAGAHLIYA